MCKEKKRLESQEYKLFISKLNLFKGKWLEKIGRYVRRHILG